MGSLRFTYPVLFFILALSFACENGLGQPKSCSSDEDCGGELNCLSCGLPSIKFCVRTHATNNFATTNNSLPFNKYAFLTTHNSFSSKGKPFFLLNQEDSVTDQLNNGVRAFMLDTYDFKDDVWLCHSNGGHCYEFTAFNPAIETFKEIYTFLSENPSEIVTLFLEDYVKAPNGLTKVFTDSGLKKFWFPVENMPHDGKDWPLVKDMVANNQRLVVFTDTKSKEQAEGIAYTWNYVVENQYGSEGEDKGKCFNRGESQPLTDKTKSLVLVNYFKSIPTEALACGDNSQPLLDMVQTCYSSAGDRWANFLAVDYYKRSTGGGAFQAVDKLNGQLLCGRDDIHACSNK